MRKSFKDSLKALEANIHFTNTLALVISLWIFLLIGVSFILVFLFQKAALYKCNVAGKPAVVTRGLYPVETISTIGKICAESTNSDHSAYVQDMSAHNFLEVGAAALLVGDMEAKMNGQPWKYFGTADMPYLDQLLQPLPVTTIANFASARSHLRAITALKCSKGGLHQIWIYCAVIDIYGRAVRLIFAI
ncbi:hypothetical protein CXB51_028007 [Gossypium anomalum]|uniref:Uncharacterized protein n=1 Tax=Gossypium anomalum TaxID=47600 RepID=A0A8J5XZT0_9ROSI|nr:hypothetical protein CXB51_028007 [Gossypium anomalum]